MWALLQVLSRSAAAILGGYAVANVSSISLALLLPMPRIDAVLVALLLSFAVYAATILWAFAARTSWQAWMGLLIPAAALGALACLAMWARTV